jgi:hypothetical protein
VRAVYLVIALGEIQRSMQLNPERTKLSSDRDVASLFILLLSVGEIFVHYPAHYGIAITATFTAAQYHEIETHLACVKSNGHKVHAPRTAC